MKVKTFLLAAIAMILSVNTALAAPVVFCSTGGPGIDLVNDGCISGESRAYGAVDATYSNAGGGDPEAKVEESIFLATGVAVDITLYGKSDDDAALFDFDPNDETSVQSGNWTVLDGTLIRYITVKGANSYALYDVGNVSSGTFTTLGILNNGGNQPNVSHISFRTAGDSTVVPEPGSIALLGAGLGTLVYLKRRRNA